MTNHFVLSTNEESDKKIQLIVKYCIYHKSDEKIKDIAYAVNLISEIIVVFGVGEDEAKACISIWAKSECEDCNLDYYWSLNEPSGFPIIRRVVSRLTSQDLVEVTPLDSPIGRLTYFDYSYSGNTDMTYSMDDISMNINRFNQQYFMGIDPIDENQ